MNNPNKLAHVHVVGQTLQRADLVALLAQCSAPAVLQDCALDGEDLSRLDLRGARFEHCTFAQTSFERSDLTQTTWQSCKAGQANFHLADLGGLTITALMQSFKGCVISADQAASLISALGVHVM